MRMPSTPVAEAARTPSWLWRARFALPVLAFLGIAIGFGLSLTRDPQVLPSALVGRPVPVFALPPVKGRTLGLASTDLAREVSLVNVFASWCVPCRTENPVLLRLKREGIVPVHGLNYKDAPDDAAKWLDTYGDPYTRTGADRDGRVGIDWGVYGVPETFVIGADGRIAYKHIGALTPGDLDHTILPLIARLRASAALSQPRGAAR